MYKDKDKQREANRKAQAKFKAKGITKQGITDRVLPDGNMDIETLAMVDAGCGDKLSHGLKPKLCKYCGNMLSHAVLECCNDCALKQPTKVSPAQDGHILASRPALEFTGKLTDFEREHYRSASELKPGQYNPVSKPGDSHYGQR